LKFDKFIIIIVCGNISAFFCVMAVLGGCDA